MKRRSLFGLALAGSLGLAGAAAAQDTTVIHERKTVVVPPSQPAPPAETATVVHHSSTVIRSSTGPARPVHHVRHVVRHPRHVAVARHTEHAVVVDHQTAPPPPADPGGVATIDRKTVIHRRDDGTVVRHTRVDKTNPDGSETHVERRTVHDPDDAPAPSPN